MSDDARAEIAARQAALVAALTTGGAPPPGVDSHRVDVAATALLHKRAGEVAWRWPGLLATTSDRKRFEVWARNRPRVSSLVEGWDFAEHLERAGDLTAPGAAELAAVRRRWARRADGSVRHRAVWAAPRARRGRAR
ncbi:hypothetical protein ACXR2U_22045 [Jatrophihabitans sp. YIM 134969]